MMLHMWSTQTWFTQILELAIAAPLVTGNQQLILPGTSRKHLFYPKLELLAVSLSKSKNIKLNMKSN